MYVNHMKKVYQRPYLLSSHWLTNSYVSIIIILTKSCIKWNPSPYVVIRKPPKPRTKCKIHFCMRKETLNKEKKTCKKLKSTFWQRTKKTFCQKDMRSSFLMMCLVEKKYNSHCSCSHYYNPVSSSSSWNGLRNEIPSSKSPQPYNTFVVEILSAQIPSTKGQISRA